MDSKRWVVRIFLSNIITEVLTMVFVIIFYKKKPWNNNFKENKLFLRSLRLGSVCPHNYNTNWFT